VSENPIIEQVAMALFLHDYGDEKDADWATIEEDERDSYRAEAERHIVVHDALGGRMPR